MARNAEPLATCRMQTCLSRESSGTPAGVKRPETKYSGELFMNKMTCARTLGSKPPACAVFAYIVTQTCIKHRTCHRLHTVNNRETCKRSTTILAWCPCALSPARARALGNARSRRALSRTVRGRARAEGPALDANARAAARARTLAPLPPAPTTTPVQTLSELPRNSRHSTVGAVG